MCARSFAESPVTGRAAPVVRQPDLVDDRGRLHPRAARIRSVTSTRASIAERARVDRRPAAVLEPDLPRELGVHLAEHLGLQLGEVRDGARHPAGGVVLGQPVGRDDVRIDLGARLVGDRVVRILGAVVVLLAARVRALRVERVVERRLVRLVVRRQRAVLEALRDEEPAAPVRLHDERVVAGDGVLGLRAVGRHVVGLLVLVEVGHVEAGPLPSPASHQT